MHIEQIEDDVLLFRGHAYQSLATGFVSGKNVLLIDALASESDAETMRRELEDQRGLTVRAILLTHCLTDHIAGLPLFPRAQIVAQRYYMHTYLSQRDRTVDDDRRFVYPTITFGDSLSFPWGRHDLHVRHNPGKTACAVWVNVPSADLVFCGDAIVGNTVYFSGAAPDLMGEALARLRALGRAWVIPGHIGRFPGAVLPNAQHYLAHIGAMASAIWRKPGLDPAADIRGILIDDCMAPGVVPTDFEREWHGHNLERIVERRLFATSQSRAA